MINQAINKQSAVIWDMGGILYRFFTEILVETAADKGWPLDKIPLGPTGIIPDTHYMALDRGDIKEPEYIRRLVDELSQQGINYIPYDDPELVPPPLRDEIWLIIEQIKAQGIRQMLLTNDATNWLGEHWWQTWPQRSFFEALVDVKNIGYPKPAPEAYKACLELLNLPPEECLFIDDMHVNCYGAEALGMNSYWFDISNPEKAAAGLKEYLCCNFIYN